MTDDFLFSLEFIYHLTVLKTIICFDPPAQYLLLLLFFITSSGFRLFPEAHTHLPLAKLQMVDFTMALV